MGPQPCATDPPVVYATTQTLYTEVNCGGCLEVSLHTTMHYPCPTPANPTETIDGTATEWETLCLLTPTLPIVPPDDRLYRRQDTTFARPACPTTLIVPVSSTGATETVYEQYTTVTSTVPCGGCDLVTSTMVGGLGAMRSPGLTATEPVGTSTVYACDG